MSNFYDNFQGMKNCAMFPAEMEIDYIRVYQNKQDSTHTLGCSPPEYPTAEYIEAHKERYENWTPQRSPYEGFGALEPTSPTQHNVEYSLVSSVFVVVGLLVMATYLKGNYKLSSLMQMRRFGYSELPSSSP